MAAKNLQDVLDATPNTVELLRNSQLGAYVYPVVPSEFSNWRHEQGAWRETAVLFDQSHHMVNLFMRGPGAIELISATAINASRTSRSTWPSSSCRPRRRATSSATASCSARRGGVRLRRPRARVELAPVPGETGGYDVQIEKGRPLAHRALWASRSPAGTGASRSRARTPGRSSRSSTAARVEQLKFFHMATMNVAGREVRTLRHGMAGAPGLEIWGPYENTPRSARRS